VIVVDTNVLLYAYNASSAFHAPARRWIEDAFSGTELIGLPWIVIVGFIRISTDPRAHTRPLTIVEATKAVDEWLSRKTVIALAPGPQHWEILSELLRRGQVRGPLATDAHIAAQTLEHGAVLATNDRDFARFEGLRWMSPIEGGNKH
jgi:uncharacterized protein